MLASSLFAIAVAVSAVSAAPNVKRNVLCDVSGDTIPLPSATPPLASPIAGGPKFIALGVGIQNYTCAAAGTYSSTGAVAELFDISCLSENKYNALATGALEAWQAAPSGVTIQEVIAELGELNPPFVLGQHYFIVNPVTGSGLSPKWDFTSASLAGNPNAFVVGARTGDVPDPTDPQTNIDWLSLSAVPGLGGNLADQVYRLQTHGGQPPSSCTPGSADISVKYTSTYWFLGGSF